MRAVRFGLVGCGRIGSTADERVEKWPVADLWLPYAHASAIAATPGAALAAVCDVDDRAASEAMRRHGAAAKFHDYREMLAAARLDALAIATRTAQRKEIVLEALRRGVRALYCEKPLSNSLEDGDEIAAAVDKAGAYFVYGTKRRFMPVYDRVRRRLREGELGDVATIVVRFGFGTLLWSLPHAVDVAAYFADDAEVEWVQADLAFDAKLLDGSVLDADPELRTACIRFRNGVSAVLVAGEGMDVEIIGRKGIVSVESDGHVVRWRKRLSDGSDIGWLLAESRDPRDPPASGTQRSIAALVRAVTSETAPEQGVRHALRNQEILFAMIESHLAGGSRTSFPLARRGLKITGRSGELYA